MSTIEFQTESSLWPEVQKCDRMLGLGWDDTQQSQASLQSILLGLHFRPRLTPSEHDLLPLLVPRSASVFLRLGEDYIHVDDALEAAMDAIPTALVTGTDAMFTHRWQPDRTDLTHARLLHTARIGLIDGRDLMLGVTEPDTEADHHDTQAHFSDLVDKFRQALSDAGEVARHLRPRLAKSAGWLLINRTSGRVLATGREVEALLQVSEGDLTGQEYSSLAERLGPIFTRCSVQFDNVAIREQHLTIVTIRPPRSKSSDLQSDPFFSQFFAHMMRNKLSAIVTASSHLGNLAAERNEPEECELTDIIQQQAGELDRQVERFRVLLDYDRLETREATLADLIKSTAARLEESGYRTKTAIPTGQVAATWDIPPVAGEVLLEAIVQSQHGHQIEAALSKITISTGSHPLAIEVTTRRSSGSTPTHKKSGWPEYIGRLSTLMGLTCESHHPDKKTTITLITTAPNRK